MDVRIRHSPTKRPRLASPLAISKEDAVRMKSQDTDHVQLRYISSDVISYDEAANESPQGFQVCVSPHLSGTNKLFQDLLAKQQRFDRMELYVNVLSTSVQVCAADLTMVPIYMLDYHMRRIFLDKKRNAKDPKHYQAIFVGKGKRKPFKGTCGDQIRYIFLLKSWNKLRKRQESHSDAEEEKETLLDSMDSLHHFEDLLISSEGCLVASLSSCGYGAIETSKIREEALAYFEGDEKGARDLGSHVFTHLFYQQRRTPLEKQCLSDEILPPENDFIFKVGQSEAFVKIGIKILALADVESRLNALPSSPYKLRTSAPTLTKAGGHVVKHYIKLKGNFTETLEFQYGSLKATLEVDSTRPSKFLDLQSIEEASGGFLGV